MSTTFSARAFWITGAGQGEIRAENLGPPTTGEVLVQTLYSGISRGTEALVFTGAVPASEFERMKAPFQDGDFPWPVKYGYINVGRVLEGPRELENKTVFCLYPHQTRYTVPAAAVYPLPDSVPPGRAVLAANLEAVVNGLWDATPRVGDRIAVVGAGTLGCLLGWLTSRIPGCEVELIDTNPGKAAAADALGVAFRRPDEATREADLVFHASGTSEGLQTALTLAGFEAKIVEMSWFGDRSVSLSLGEAFHANRLTLTSSQVGIIAGAQRARWNSRRRMALVLELLADQRLDTLITGESRFEELPQVLQRLSSEPGDTLCHRIIYTDGRN